MTKPSAPLGLYSLIATVLSVPFMLSDHHLTDFPVAFLFTVVGGELLRTCFRWLRYRCPYCKCRDTTFHCYDGLEPDEQYAYYKCGNCPNLSIEFNRKLVKRFF